MEPVNGLRLEGSDKELAENSVPEGEMVERRYERLQSVHSFHNNYYFLILGGPGLFFKNLR